MKILFLDQSGNLGGAELCLLDIAKPHRDSCLVSLFVDGSFRQALERHQIPVRVLSTQSIPVHKDSNLWQALSSLGQFIPLVREVVRLSYAYKLIYANTQKALVVGAIASAISRRPLVYHLHDILSPSHFSLTNRRIAVLLANRFASRVIANSRATQSAFIEAGGRADLVEVIYNGFQPECYENLTESALQLTEQLNLNGRFVVGHFSRLSPWKGQHILLQALTHCSENVVALFVGDALFGEREYVEQLHQQVAQLKLNNRVRFLGFRSDIPQLMAACALVAHTSIAPEPFGRVIVEAMLCDRPVVAAAAGGAIELVAHGKTGWLTPPGDPLKLATIINHCLTQPERAAAIARAAKLEASQRFDLSATNQQIERLLGRVVQMRE
jgi:glycosyltransferase involved in cell wall biosynthesis